MKQLRKLLNELEVLEMESTKAEEAYELDYMNEDLEKAFDEAYNREYNKRQETASYIAVYTNLKIEVSQALEMINNPLIRVRIANMLA